MQLVYVCNSAFEPGNLDLRIYGAIKMLLLLLETLTPGELIGVNSEHEQTLCAAAKHTTEYKSSAVWCVFWEDANLLKCFSRDSTQNPCHWLPLANIFISRCYPITKHSVFCL